jgi:ABC-type molybdate transport system ATPase subunit
VRGVIDPTLSVGQCVNGLLRPSDITLAMSPAETITMQNRLPGVVRQVIEQGNRHFCVVDVNEHGTTPSVLVEVTQQAIAEFNLGPGVRTWCLFKASALSLHADVMTDQADPQMQLPNTDRFNCPCPQYRDTTCQN